MDNRHYAIGCIKRAVSFIETSLRDEEVPKLDEIASASNLSKYHFHRIFKIVTGETCAQTVTRLRLARGAGTLTDEGASITTAAMTAGYASSQAFAKAMKRETTQTASDLRSDPDRLTSVIRTLSEPASTGHQDGPALRIELASLEPFEVVTRRTVGVYPGLHATYGELFEYAEDPGRVLAIIGQPMGDIEAPEPTTFTFDCGIKLDGLLATLPARLSRNCIDGGEYLLARNRGSYDGLPSTLDALYGFILANPEIKLVDAPCLFHYLDSPDETAEADLRTDIYIQIQSST